MWIRIHDTLEENGIDTILVNPYKTKIIAEANISKSFTTNRWSPVFNRERGLKKFAATYDQFEGGYFHSVKHRFKVSFLITVIIEFAKLSRRGNSHSRQKRRDDEIWSVPTFLLIIKLRFAFIILSNSFRCLAFR